MIEKFNTLIVEDDKVNIELLTLLLNKYCQNISLVGAARNSKEFIDMYLRLQPDILILDIDLGEEKNTLDVLNEIGQINCQIIITSSHKKYAINAINQYHVAGYILKPINITSFTKAITVAKQNILQNKILEGTKKNYEIIQNIIGIPTEKCIDLIDIKDILYLEADGKYTVFHMTKDIKKIVSKNIGYYEKILPTHLFFRIHHKYIVNIKKITTISRSDGSYCMLNNGKSLSIANRRRDKLRRLLHVR